MRGCILLLCALSSSATTLPVRFDQVSDAAFLCEGRGYRVRLSRGEIAVEWGQTSSHMKLVGARASAPEGIERAAGAANYFLGSERRTNLAGFSRVRYHDVYPGIDLVFYGAGGAIEYDFVVSPGADPSRIQIAISGAKWKLDAEGGLELVPLVWRQPKAYQGSNQIASHFQVRGNVASFSLGSWDHSQSMTIDPVLAYATYLGAANNEAARAIGLDSAGNVYIAGYTTSNNLPVSRTAVQPAYGGQTANFMTGDAFVAKYNPAGVLQYLTYLGGSGDDVASAIAVDGAGNAYVTGYTNSRDFPVSANPAQPIYAGAGGNTLVRFGDAFVTKLGPNGDRMIYSTFYGGSADEMALGIAIDSTGAAFITGVTQSFNLPTTQGVLQPRFRGAGGQPDTAFCVPFFIAGDGFVANLNPAGSAVVWATYLGGLLDDTPMAIALDKNGNVVVAGNTLSVDYPTTVGALQRQNRGSDVENPFFHLGDGFITKLTPDGTALVWSTYLGASGDDSITALALDSTGAVYVAGTTSSTNFPVTTGAFQTKYGGPVTDPSRERITGDGYLAKLDPTGSSLMFATYIGGSSDEGAYAIALGSDGTIWIAGQTTSSDFPTTSDASQRGLAGQGGENNNGDNWGDGFLVNLSADGSKMIFGTLIGGSIDDTVQGVALDGSGSVWVTGCTMSGNFPTTSGAQQAKFGGFSFVGRLKGDAFLARFGAPPPPPPPALKVNAVANAASNAAGTVSPGMIFVAYGAGIGPTTLAGASLDASGKLANAIAGTQILFDGVPAPLVYSSATQVSGIVPYAVANKTTTQVTATYQGQTSAALSVKVGAAVPALFSADFSGSGQGAILNQDGSYNSAANPAAAGSIIVLFGTGEGQTTPAGVDGLVASGTPPKPNQPVTVTIGGRAADVVYEGGAPQAVAGLYQVNVTIPPGASVGNQPVILTVGGVPSASGLTVAVK